MSSRSRSNEVKSGGKNPGNVQDSPLPNTNATLPASHNVSHPSDAIPSTKIEEPTVERQKRPGKDMSDGPSPLPNADSLQGLVDRQVTVYVASNPNEMGFGLTLNKNIPAVHHKVGDANVYLWVLQEQRPVELWKYEEVERLEKKAIAQKEEAIAQRTKAIAQRDGAITRQRHAARTRNWVFTLCSILCLAGAWCAEHPTHWSLVTSSLRPTQPQWPSQAPALTSLVWDLFSHETCVADTIYYGKNGERGIDKAAYSKDLAAPLQSLVDSLASTKLQAKSVFGHITDGRFNGSSVHQCSYALQTTLSTLSGSRTTSLAYNLPHWVAKSLALRPPQPARSSLTEIHHYCQRHFGLEVVRYSESTRDISRLDSAIGNTSQVASATANATALAAERHKLSLFTAWSSCIAPDSADSVTLDQLLRGSAPAALAQVEHFMSQRALMAGRIQRDAEMLFHSVGDLTDSSNVGPWNNVHWLDRGVREYMRGGEEFQSQLPVMDEAYWQNRAEGNDAASMSLTAGVSKVVVPGKGQVQPLQSMSETTF